MRTPSVVECSRRCSVSRATNSGADITVMRCPARPFFISAGVTLTSSAPASIRSSHIAATRFGAMSSMFVSMMVTPVFSSTRSPIQTASAFPGVSRLPIPDAVCARRWIGHEFPAHTCVCHLDGTHHKRSPFNNRKPGIRGSSRAFCAAASDSANSSRWPGGACGRRTWAGNALLRVLHLLAHLLDQDLHVHGAARGLQILGLRRQGVRFAIELLHEEVEPAAGGLTRADDAAHFADVAREALELLVHVEPLQQQRQLLLEALLVDTRGQLRK